MKYKNYLSILFMLGLLITACRTQDTPSQALPSPTTPSKETEVEIPTKTSAPTMLATISTSDPLPTTLTDLRNITENPDVNATIAALLDQDLEALMDAVMLNSQPCTTQPALGGPPECPPGVNDGTVLSFFPVLGPGEGSRLNPDEVSRVFDYQNPVLSAVIIVKPPEVNDRDFPYGSYAVILTIGPNDFARTFRLNNQGKILRVDYTVWPSEQEINNIQGNIIFEKH